MTQLRVAVIFLSQLRATANFSSQLRATASQFFAITGHSAIAVTPQLRRNLTAIEHMGLHETDNHNHPGSAVSSEIRAFEGKIRVRAANCNETTEAIIDNCLANLSTNFRSDQFSATNFRSTNFRSTNFRSPA